MKKIRMERQHKEQTVENGGTYNTEDAKGNAEEGTISDGEELLVSTTSDWLYLLMSKAILNFGLLVIISFII